VEFDDEGNVIETFGVTPLARDLATAWVHPGGLAVPEYRHTIFKFVWCFQQQVFRGLFP
jgi:hypothetical protein